MRGVIQEFVVSNLRRWDASATAGEVLSLLTRDGRHQELLDAALERLGGYLGTEEVRERASNLLVKFARKEWPRIIAAVDVIASVDGIADNLADRLARALVQELREVLSQPDHPVRQDYEGWLQDYRTAAQRSGAGGAGRGAQAARHRSSEGAGVRARTMGRHPRGAAATVHAGLGAGAHLESALLAMGRRLAEDAALREALNRHVLGAARRLTGGCAPASPGISRAPSRTGTSAIWSTSWS